jgi:hypothetical protein
MFEDAYLDTFMEDQINGGYGYILDALDSAGDSTPEDVDGSDIGNDCSEFNDELDVPRPWDNE